MGVRYLDESPPPSSGRIKYLDDETFVQPAPAVSTANVPVAEESLSPQQQMFRELPIAERSLAGVGKEFMETADVLRGGGGYPGMGQEQMTGLNQRNELARQQRQSDLYQPYEEASRGDIAAGAGEIFGDVALTAMPVMKGAKVGTKIASKIPKVGQMLATTAGGLGAGAGSNIVHQAQSVGRTGELDPVGAGIELGLSGALPGIGKLARQLLKLPSYVANEVAEQIGQVPLEGLQMWSTKSGRKALKSSWGQELPKAKELANNIFNASKSLPHRKLVNNALLRTPKIDPAPITKSIDDAIGEVSLESTNKGMILKLKKLKKDFSLEKKSLPKVIRAGEKGAMPIKINASSKYPGKWEVWSRWNDPRKLGPGQLETLPKYFDSQADAMTEMARQGYKMPKFETPKISAGKLRAMRMELDDIIDWNAPGANKLNGLLMKPRGTAASLLEANAPPQYKALMADYADKLNKISNMKLKLGNKKTEATQKAFNLLRNVDNATRQPVKEILEEYDATFGTSFLKDAELMHMGRMLGKPGKAALELPLLPKGATGNRVVALMTMGLGFPRVSPYLLKAIESPTKFAEWASKNIPESVKAGLNQPIRSEIQRQRSN